MPLSLQLSDEIVSAIRLGGDDMGTELKKELAIGLYQRKALSAGKAAELAGMGRMDFEDLLHAREIPSSYSIEDLEHDLRLVAQLTANSPESAA